MRQITYAMQFRGKAAAVGESPPRLKASLRGAGCRLTTEIGDTGVSAALGSLPGGSATFDSEVVFVSETAFKESGVIAFGNERNRLRFSTIGEGYLGSSPNGATKHGSVMWRVDGGEGQFEGASGLITSNFFVGADGNVVDNHFGAIFVKD